jgi:hypothetical protein
MFKVNKKEWCIKSLHSWSLRIIICFKRIRKLILTIREIICLSLKFSKEMEILNLKNMKVKDPVIVALKLMESQQQIIKLTLFSWKLLSKLLSKKLIKFIEICRWIKINSINLTGFLNIEYSSTETLKTYIFK